MFKFTDKELKRYAVAGVIAALTGLVMLMIGRIIHDEATFWEPYTAAFQGISWLVILISIMWFGMSVAHLYTSFFDIKEPLSTDKAVLHIAVIVIIMLLAGAYAVAKMPATSVDKLPRDPKEREALLAREARDRHYVVVLFLGVGASFAAFPCIRCFGPRLFPAQQETARQSS